MAKQSLSIRPAEVNDLEAVLDLWRSMMARHERNDARIRMAEGALSAYRAYLGYHLVHTESCVRVAEAAGEVVGFCLLTITRNLPMFLPPRYGYLSDLVVTESHRRRGIGRALVKESIRWLRKHGINSIQLQYYSFNGEGESFWKSMGFQPYYTRMWLDMG